MERFKKDTEQLNIMNLIHETRPTKAMKALWVRPLEELIEALPDYNFTLWDPGLTSSVKTYVSLYYDKKEGELFTISIAKLENPIISIISEYSIILAKILTKILTGYNVILTVTGNDEKYVKAKIQDITSTLKAKKNIHFSKHEKLENRIRSQQINKAFYSEE